MVSEVWYYHLDARSWKEIRVEFTDSLRAQDPQFWSDRSDASFATLMRIHNVRELPEIECRKRDRRGWVTLVETQYAPNDRPNADQGKPKKGVTRAHFKPLSEPPQRSRQ